MPQLIARAIKPATIAIIQDGIAGQNAAGEYPTQKRGFANSTRSMDNNFRLS